MNQKLQAKEKLKIDMINFQKSQTIWKEAQRQEIEDENRRIAEFLRVRDEKLKDSDSRKREVEQQRQELVERMGTELNVNAVSLLVFYFRIRISLFYR